MAQADTVHLKGGRTLHAQQCRKDGSELRCSQAGGVIGIPLEQIERVESDSDQAPRRTRVLPAAQPAATFPPLLPDLGAMPGGALTPAAARSRIDELNEALHRPAGDTPAVHRELSLLHTFLGNSAMLAHNYEDAVERYRNALEHDPRLVVARLNLCTALIDLGHHDAAETILQTLLGEQPDNARAMGLLGEVRLQTGRLDEAIELWEKAMKLQPSEGLQARLERARRLKQAEAGFQRSEAAHFSLAFDGEQASGELADEILRYLEDSFSQLLIRFAQYPEAVIRVTLYSQRAFQEATTSPDWVGGLFDGQVRVPIGGLSHLTPQLRRVLIHELTHCFVASKSRGNAPQWIQEGIAQVLEGKSGASSRAALRQAYEAPGGQAGASEFSYPRALSQVEFFLRTWSDSHFNDLLDHLGRGTDIDASLRAVTGLSYPEFLNAWGESLSG